MQTFFKQFFKFEIHGFLPDCKPHCPQSKLTIQNLLVILQITYYFFIFNFIDVEVNDFIYLWQFEDVPNDIYFKFFEKACKNSINNIPTLNISNYMSHYKKMIESTYTGAMSIIRKFGTFIFMYTIGNEYLKKNIDESVMPQHLKICDNICDVELLPTIFTNQMLTEKQMVLFIKTHKFTVLRVCFSDFFQNNFKLIIERLKNKSNESNGILNNQNVKYNTVSPIWIPPSKYYLCILDEMMVTYNSKDCSHRVLFRMAKYFLTKFNPEYLPFYLSRYFLTIFFQIFQIHFYKIALLMENVGN